MTRHEIISALCEQSGLQGAERQIFRVNAARLIRNGGATDQECDLARSAAMAAVEASRDGVVTPGTPNQRVRGPSEIREWHRQASALMDRIRDRSA